MRIGVWERDRNEIALLPRCMRCNGVRRPPDTPPPIAPIPGGGCDGERLKRRSTGDNDALRRMAFTPGGGEGDMLKLRNRLGEAERLCECVELREKLRDGLRRSKLIERLLADRVASRP